MAVNAHEIQSETYSSLRSRSAKLNPNLFFDCSSLERKPGCSGKGYAIGFSEKICIICARGGAS